MSENGYFIANYLITGTINLKTGLHIGDSKDSVEIGVIDNPIIKNRITGYPYIPGSSLKGKLRTLLELSDIKYKNSGDGKKGIPSNDLNVESAKLFGISPDNKEISEKPNFPTRLIVRDSFHVEGMDEKWNNAEDIVQGAEVKYENTIDSITSKATPRPVERIPQSSKFDFEMVLSQYESDEIVDNFVNLFKSMFLLEDNYLGGSGSRGYGKIKFENINIEKRDDKFYKFDENNNGQPVKFGFINKFNKEDIEKLINNSQ
ncbi:type III-A CRISPR-associated RAMP protein Csm3 [Methanobrevibacter curvatus]|uniref:CRISPR system Cms endoribonuclease Csm3 n=1 Tax=Methanobrevibacter curvatus TaxID=49547 RepID=A0A166ANL8_9EURY|nr:type III-A CRISPR-associated RAMP protein Csm3 [Methanobrevibacter curvatus]KZX12271.1 RAMP superfamily protein [Methanobrevibacter curvatus]